MEYLLSAIVHFGRPVAIDHISYKREILNEKLFYDFNQNHTINWPTSNQIQVLWLTSIIIINTVPLHFINNFQSYTAKQLHSSRYVAGEQHMFARFEWNIFIIYVIATIYIPIFHNFHHFFFYFFFFLLSLFWPLSASIFA